MSDKQPIRILLVDDDDTFSEVLARALTRRGYTVCRASSYTDALSQAAKQQPDQAIVDLNLGSHTGLQLIPVLPDKQV